LVFKVRLRGLVSIMAFQRLPCQEQIGNLLSNPLVASIPAIARIDFCSLVALTLMV
jgi:hypothetical protein